MAGIHILIVPSELYLPSYNKLSGIFQQHHAELLTEFGNKIGIISAGFLPLKQAILGSKYKYVENVEGIKIYRKFIRLPLPARINVRFLKFLLIRSYVKLFEKYINDNGIPDVIHAHNCLYAGLAAVEIKKKFNIPIILTEHSSLYERELLSGNQHKDARLVLRKCDYITVVSSALGESIKKALGISDLKYIPIYNVLDFKLATQSSFANSQIYNSFTFLSVGSLDKNKNHELLIRAFAMLFKGNLKYQLRIAGDGPLRSNLENLAQKLEITDQFYLCGQLNRQELADEYSNSNVVVLTSKVETFGVVLLEALSFGKPIVSTDSGGPRDIVDGENGYLVKNDDIQALLNGLKRIAENYTDFNSDKIRANCFNKFNKLAFYKRLEEIYLQIVQV